MASLIVTSAAAANAAGVASGAAGFVSWNPFLVFGAVALTSFLDQQYLYPKLLGSRKGKDSANPNPLIGLPQTTNVSGTPRVWAIGRRVRVPTHVMYASQKVRESTVGGGKGGVPSTIRRVFADVAISINDRPTSNLLQLAANGQLIYYTERNLIRIETHRMSGTPQTTVALSGSVAAGSTSLVINRTGGGMTANAYEDNFHWLQMTSGASAGEAVPITDNTATQITLNRAFTNGFVVGDTFNIILKPMVFTMDTTYEPSFADYFQVNDVVRLENMQGQGATLGGQVPWTQFSWWRVTAVAAHSATPSTITLQPCIGQNIGPLTGIVSGNAFNPGSMVREDSYLLLDEQVSGGWGPSATVTAQFKNPNDDGLFLTHARRFIGASSDLRVALWGYRILDSLGNPQNVLTSWEWGIWTTSGGGINPTAGVMLRNISNTLGNYNFTGMDTTGLRAVNPVIYRYYGDPGYETSMFQSNPGSRFYQGTDEQQNDDVLGRNIPSLEVPGYRGLTYVVLDQWDLSTYFGNQVPPIVEAIIGPDQFMTVQQAFLEVCRRSKSTDIEFDTSGISGDAFQGYWTQGPLPTVTALQPLMVAYQVAAQERNNVLAFFQIENADVVQIENGAVFSDLGTRSGSDTPDAGDKIRISQRDPSELPTSIGITHQDPDYQYTQGFQNYRQRQPTVVNDDSENILQLDNLVLARQHVRDLAATIMRRTWVNGTSLEMQLPVAYIHVLENDLITVTDDNAYDYTARVIRREVGNNFIVSITAVVEDVDLAVAGSPVQALQSYEISVPLPVDPIPRIMDMAPLRDGEAFTAGYYVGAVSPQDIAWNGAKVYESRDGGTNWTEVATLNQQIGAGTLTTALASGPAGDLISLVTWDTVNTFTVAVDNFGPLGSWYSVTNQDVIDGANWFLIDTGTVQEIVGARDVTDNGDGTYTMSYLIRGLRGTAGYVGGTKAVGSKVTYLSYAGDAAKFVPLNLSASNLPIALDLKFVAPGQTLADVTAQSVTINAWNARPMPGRMFSTDLDLGTYDRTFIFEPWTRLQTPVGGGGPYNLDETFEGYSVRIYDPTGATLMRTKTISSGPTGANRLRGTVEFVYTAAEQTTDGYTPGPSETFKVERVQLGDFGEGRSWMEDV